MILKKTIEEVFDVARIDDVVSDFMNLKPRGSNMLGLCPFHDEKTPSFSVSPSKNIYKCFGCGRGGGPVQFIMEHEKYTYPEAIRYLAQKYGIEVLETEESDEYREERQEMESLHLVNQFAQAHFVDNLYTSDEGCNVGMTYFKERGFLESTVKRFGLGYAMSDSGTLRSAAMEAGYTEERLKTLGLVSKSSRDFFRGRVIFPIHNLSGKVIAFGARTLKQGPREPKYLNSLESPVYNKRKSLYGIHLAKHAIRKQDRCYLVEGYTDVISLAQSGIENVVSSSGTALTNDQVKAIKRFTSNIVVLYDGDTAGIKAAMRGLDLMLEEDVDVKLVLLPDGNDPDATVSALGADRFKAFLEKEAKDFILFKTQFLNETDGRDPVRRSQVIRDIVNSIALVPDPIKRDSYLRECALRLEIDENILIEETNHIIRGNLKKSRMKNRHREVRSDFDTLSQVEHPVPGRHNHDVTKKESYTDDHQELAIAGVLIRFGDARIITEDGMEISVAAYVLQGIKDVLESFDNRRVKRLISLFLPVLKGAPCPTTDTLLASEDAEIVEVVVSILHPPYEYSENWVKLKHMPLVTQKPPEENYLNEAVDSILRVKQRKIQRQIKENRDQIVQFSASRDDKNLELRLKMHEALLKLKASVEEQLNTIGIRL